MKEILVKDAPELSTIEIKTAGSFDPDCTRLTL